ncbi:ATP-binding protein [Corynebacterium sp. AOP12-C2-36]|uniref:ATP-binding protein n=1 Tax=Corynebacterium sp. AOP12-C2-36 TaxID=3457723 RepID=UPI0040343971
MDYRAKMKKRTRNFAFMADGSVWANYICEGIPIDFFTPGSLDSASREHAALYDHLMGLGLPEVLLGGYLTRVSAEERLAPVYAGIPDLSNENYPSMVKTMSAYTAAVKSNRYPRYRRLYWVSVRLGVSMSAVGRLSSAIWETDPFGDVTKNDLEHADDIIRAKFPDSFGMRLAQPEDFDWLYDRCRLRGIRVPEAPAYQSRRRVPVTASTAAFPDIAVGGNPDGEALISDFATRYGNDDAPGARKSLTEYFRSLRSGNFVEVRNPNERTEKLPDGPISYQSVFAIARYGDTQDRNARGFTSMVDQATGLDGDFVHRIRPADYSEPKSLDETLKNLGAERKANANSGLDEDRYADMYNGVREFSDELRRDGASAKFKVTTFFAFGSPRLDVLTKTAPQIKASLEHAGYRTYCPTGLVEEMWDMTWPCVTSTSLVSDLAGTTTSALMGEYAPMRFHRVGDAKGIPLGQNIDDMLGNDVHLDVLNPTEEGNGSIAITGAQGRGKSHLMKIIVAWLADLRMTTVVLDGQGEWATYASTLPDAQVIDLVNPTVSVDPLKIMDTRPACEILAALFLPLLGVSPDTEAGALLASKFDYRWVESRGYATTRQLLEGIVSPSARSSLIADAIASIQRLLDNRIADAFIDPEINGRVSVLPPAKFTANTIVFYTKGLTLPTPGKAEERTTLSERFGLMANTAVALLTKHRFDNISGTKAFVLDEAHFLDGLDVLTQMIKEPDRTGRKHGTFVLVGSQLGEELNKPAYRLIRRKFCMGQDNHPNASEALDWADFLPSPGLVKDLVSNTSPLRRNRENRPVTGRAGECYFNDGSAKSKMKVFDQFRTDRRVVADTTASRYIRYGTESPDAAASVA